jgi:hypothetical protein
MQASDVSVDLRRHVLRVGDEEVQLLRPGARPRSNPCVKENRDLAVALCDRVVAVRLEGLREAVDIL